MNFDSICTGCGRPIYAMRRDENLGIINKVASEHGVTFEDVMGNSRMQHVIYARHECFNALQNAGLSSSQVGRLMGRDHTTVLHGAKRHRERASRLARGLS